MSDSLSRLLKTNQTDTRLSEIQNGFSGLKAFSAMLAYSCTVKFSQNLPDRMKFYWTYMSFGPADFRKAERPVLTVDLGEVKTAPTECKEKCFQMSHLPIFTILKHLKMCWC